jgi:hypothetical protein
MPTDHHEHPHHTPPHDIPSHTAHTPPRHNHQRSEHTPPTRVTSDPYPFIYSKDVFDRRRYSPFGGAPTGRVSRGMAIFSVVIIVAVLGVGLATILIGAFGK